MLDKKDQDLQMYDKVISLSDLAICLLLAKIEKLPTYTQLGLVKIVAEDGNDYFFNPLENNDQFVGLIEKHDVERVWHPYDFFGWGYHVMNGKNPLIILERQQFDENESQNLTMKKASCLAIILNKSETYKLDSIK
jgi:hypothetical protein